MFPSDDAMLTYFVFLCEHVLMELVNNMTNSENPVHTSLTIRKQNKYPPNNK